MLIKLISAILLFLLCACGTSETERTNMQSANETSSEASQENVQQFSAATAVVITVGQQNFLAKFYENEVSEHLMNQMPFTVTMSDLNNNEKYYRFSENLPEMTTERPEIIHEGEIMSWNSHTLVLFYQTFTNSYGGYNRIGVIEDPTGLKEVLGAEDVEVIFSLRNPRE
ncbi:cyclophilin-like fold protein [Enterococcus entomosocium]|uniref:Cyclophilin-like fold protein n=1 Tax=Enterococcus entomosocium TaxID=3034352 RepID=A0ABV3MF02_9ENTE|nr:cyclophilin-like fold protein [Enterococcus casseliflavus]MDB1710099.1 cyclophilin-like fold protein [Enterococcus casseliflavus]MDB1716277.1 cyclophilin-like fold protein [Enterococcus casseliflavus]